MCYYLVLLIADQRAEFVRGADRDAALQRGEDRQRLPGLLRPVPLAGEGECVHCLSAEQTVHFFVYLLNESKRGFPAVNFLNVSAVQTLPPQMCGETAVCRAVLITVLPRSRCAGLPSSASPRPTGEL